jgi:dienelactone hydrolase
VVRVLLTAALLVTGLAAQTPSGDFEKGRVIARVACLSKPEQTYALYLPKSYDPAKKWPILLVFEPAARGPLPVNIMKDAAEKYGYIVMSSNNSRNGPWQPQMDAADAMWKDAQVRYSIDLKRLYFAGFSGGARVGVALAAGCKGCAAGVFASGAGFPLGLEPKKTGGFVLFSAIGREDFNYPEILLLEPELKEANFTFHVRRFDGKHEWAPAEVWDEAFAWFNLQAMRAGTLHKDVAFIRGFYQRSLAEANNLASTGQEYEAFRQYRQLASDFGGLTDVAEPQRRIAGLEKSKAVKEGLKREKQAAEQQVQMAEPINSRIQVLTQDHTQTRTQLNELSRLFSEIRRRAKDDKDPQQMIAKRVLTQEFVHAYESGAHMIDAKDYGNALILYEVITANATKAPGAHLQRARAYAALGNKNNALEELRAAIRDGVSDSEDLKDPEFAALQKDPAFQSIADSLHQTKAE